MKNMYQHRTAIQLCSHLTHDEIIVNGFISIGRSKYFIKFSGFNDTNSDDRFSDCESIQV